MNTLDHRGHPIRWLTNPLDGLPYLNATDVIAAAGLMGKFTPALLRRRYGAAATMRVQRRAFKETLGSRGSAEVLFIRLAELERWGRRQPDTTLDQMMQALRQEHFSPFEPA